MNIARRVPLLLLVIVLAFGIVLFFLHDGGYLPTGGLLGQDGGSGDGAGWENGKDGTGTAKGGADDGRATRLQGAPGARLAEDPTSGRPGDPSGRNARGREVGEIAQVPFGGVVKDTDGAVVQGGHVVVLGASGRQEAETDEAGRFHLDLQPGRYKLLFEAEGLGALALKDYLIDGAAGSKLEFLLKETLCFEVAVLQDGIGVMGADVVLNAKLGLGSKVGKTDVEGTVVLEGVPQGAYALRVDLQEGVGIRRSLDLTKDQALVLKVPPGVRVFGRVVDGESAATIAGARVTFQVSVGSGAWARVEVESDADGCYEASVPQQRVRDVTVVAAGYAAWSSRKKRRTVTRRLAGIQKGIETELDVTLASGLAVAGRVTDDKGAPVVGLSFRFVQRNSVFAVVTEDEGEYEISGLSPGRYDVVVLSEGWFPPRTLRLNLPRLDSGETLPYDFEVHPTLEISGRVLDEARKPAVGARVFVTGGGRLLRAAHVAGRDLETFTDVMGWWRIRDLPVNQNVKVRASLGVLEATPRSIRTAALPGKPLELRLQRTVSLKGEVHDLVRRVPVEGATVDLKPVGKPGGRTARRLKTDAEGRFEAYELIPGRWTLQPKHGSFLPGELREEDLGADDEVVEVLLGLDPGLAVSGIVLDTAGRPLAGVQVTVTGTSEDGAKVRRRVLVRAGGRFRLTGFVRGAYTLTARRTGYRTGRVKGLLGGERALEVQLRALPKKS